MCVFATSFFRYVGVVDLYVARIGLQGRRIRNKSARFHVAARRFQREHTVRTARKHDVAVTRLDVDIDKSGGGQSDHRLRRYPIQVERVIRPVVTALFPQGEFAAFRRNGKVGFFAYLLCRR